MNTNLGKIHLKSLKKLSKKLEKLVRSHLWVKILIAMVLGVLTGILLSPDTGLVGSKASSTIGEWVALPGHLFLTLIQMIVIPLIFASVIRGIAASEDVDQLKRVGSRVVVYFLVTTTIAIIIGLSVAYLIKPGTYIDPGMLDAAAGQETVLESPEMETLPDMIVGLLPQNPLSAMVESQMLQVVIFSMILGIALIAMAPKAAKPILDLLGSLQEVCMTVVQWAMKLAPFAVFGLLAQITIKIGLDALLGMGIYVITVILGLLLLLVFYLLLVFFLGKKNPWKFLKHIREVQLLAFSASSSAAVMP
ncbi:MAG: cation:dicarboxylase symporter family transporter, partial [Clostridia bacterium]